MKKWSQKNKPTCLFVNSHNDKAGGGELYAHQLAESFSHITNFRYFGDHIKSDFRKNHNFYHKFIHTGLAVESDILLSCSHFAIPEPVGKHRNILITFFPNKDHAEQVKGYDTIITCSNFSAEWVKKYWKKKAVCIHPYLEVEKSPKIEKEPYSIINVSRFIKESDGHGKRQDILLEAFARLKRFVPDAKITFCGMTFNPDDDAYLSELKSLAKKLKVEDSVEFVVGANRDEINDRYSKAHFYWHANGYQQTDPFKTEHFGIVIQEALMYGCEAFVYRQGGYKDFNCYNWGSIPELVDLTFKACTYTASVREISNSTLAKFSKQKMIDGVKKLIMR